MAHGGLDEHLVGGAAALTGLVAYRRVGLRARAATPDAPGRAAAATALSRGARGRDREPAAARGAPDAGAEARVVHQAAGPAHAPPGGGSRSRRATSTRERGERVLRVARRWPAPAGSPRRARGAARAGPARRPAPPRRAPRDASRRARRGRPLTRAVAARASARPIQKAEPSSPRSGPRPPARAQRPRASRPSAIEPVPARRRMPGSRRRARPRSAASTSEITRTRRARPREPPRRRAPLAAVQTPREATTSASTAAGPSRPRRHRRARSAGEIRGRSASVRRSGPGGRPARRRPRASTCRPRRRRPPRAAGVDRRRRGACPPRVSRPALYGDMRGAAARAGRIMAGAHAAGAPSSRRTDVARLRGPRRRSRARSSSSGSAFSARAARHRRLLPRPPPHPVVGRVPVLPRHRDQRGHDHLGAGHRVQRELGVRPVLRRVEPRQVRGRAALFIPAFYRYDCTTIYEFLGHRFGTREPGHRLDLLLRHAAARLRACD